jgi:hypothetical protein
MQAILNPAPGSPTRRHAAAIAGPVRKPAFFLLVEGAWKIPVAMRRNVCMSDADAPWSELEARIQFLEAENRRLAQQHEEILRHRVRTVLDSEKEV